MSELGLASHQQRGQTEMGPWLKVSSKDRRSGGSILIPGLVQRYQELTILGLEEEQLNRTDLLEDSLIKNWNI